MILSKAPREICKKQLLFSTIAMAAKQGAAATGASFSVILLAPKRAASAGHVHVRL